MDLTFWWWELRGDIKQDKYIICQMVISDRKKIKAVEVGLKVIGCCFTSNDQMIFDQMIFKQKM